jgi:hypothetical protein
MLEEREECLSPFASKSRLSRAGSDRRNPARYAWNFNATGTALYTAILSED